MSDKGESKLFFLLRYFKDNETIIYKVKKKKKPIFFLLIVFPVWLIICLISIAPCFESMFTDKINFDSYFAYIASIFIIIVFITLILAPSLNYIFNSIILTDKRVYIRKAFGGSLEIIDIAQIAEYEYEETDFKCFKGYYFLFKLKNGQRLKTGNLYITCESVEVLKNALKGETHLTLSKTCFPAFCVLPNKKENSLTEEEKNYKFNIHRNFLFLAIYYSPVIISLVMLIFLFLGVNEKIGMQKNIEIIGIVSEKEFSRDSRSGESYRFKVQDLNTMQIYDMYVSKEIYDSFEKQKGVKVLAKKGSLGIVYNKVFLKN